MPTYTCRNYKTRRQFLTSAIRSMIDDAYSCFLRSISTSNLGRFTEIVAFNTALVSDYAALPFTPP